jgi:hypothetical protein
MPPQAYAWELGAGVAAALLAGTVFNLAAVLVLQ